jgi:hypothetical protein
MKKNGVIFEGNFENGMFNGVMTITLPFAKEKVNMHPSHITVPRLSYECPPRPPDFSAFVEFAI